MAKKSTHQKSFESISIVGGLIGNQVLVDIRGKNLEHLDPAGYGLVKGLELNDEITRYWRIAKSHWDSFQKDLQLSNAKPAKLTRTFIKYIFEDVLQYPIENCNTQTIGERNFPIRLMAFNKSVPIVVSQPDLELDKADDDFGQENLKRSAAGLVQEYLNASDSALWGMVSDGIFLRVYRDNPAMTRPAWLEIDFQRLFDEDNLGDFAALSLIHI